MCVRVCSVVSHFTPTGRTLTILQLMQSHGPMVE